MRNSRFHSIPALDGIRGLAIVLVMLHHFEPLIPASNSAIAAVKAAFSFGWMGVDLFFALSGFLITGILLDTRESNNYFQSFYARRALRIFPLYYSVLTFVLLVVSLIHPRPNSVPVVADEKLYYFYLVNWLALWKGPWRANFLAHFWSLAVEEQFYLLWPLCVWLFVRRNLTKVAVIGSIIALVIRIGWLAHAGPGQAIVMATVTRMDSLLCGAVSAIMFRNVKLLASLRTYLPWVAGSALLCFATAGGWLRLVYGPGGEQSFVQTIGYSLLAFGFSGLVLHIGLTDDRATFTQKVFRNKTLTNFGKYSYGIYVYHVPLLGLVGMILAKARIEAFKEQLWFGLCCVILLFVCSFLIAMLSYELLERPFLNLKRYFEARKSAEPKAAVLEVST